MVSNECDIVRHIYQHRFNATTLHTIRKRLRKNKIRRKYHTAQVFYPQKGEYGVSPNRQSLKATFYDQDLVNLIRKHVPNHIELLSSEHVDLLKYTTGDFFKEHTDFVDCHPHGGEQVTIIVGLQNASSGGTRIRFNTETIVYNESITKGGLLIFPSRLPHSGEPVKGEKEILVFKGFSFIPCSLIQQLRSSVYCDVIHVLAIYKEFQSYYRGYEDLSEDNHVQLAPPQQPTPLFYVYHHNTLVARFDAHDGTCIRYSSPQPIDNMQHEQVHKLEGHEQHAINGHPYPLLSKTIHRKKLIHCFAQCTNQQTFSKTRYTYEREFCNNGYDIVKIPAGIVHRHGKRFCIALFNENYYAFWLSRVNSRLTTSIQRVILSYLIL